MKKIKDYLKQQFLVLKGELYLNFPVWLVQTIITAAVMLMLLLLCFVSLGDNFSLSSYLFGVMSDTTTAANMFQSYFQGFMLSVCGAFSLVYMIKSLSYIYNRRKLDMYGSLPISRRSFFCGKLFSSFVMSVMVFVVFEGIAFIIGIFTGATFENHEIGTAVSFVFYTFFIISFYSLCVVCSKTVWTAVISMFIIEAFLPLIVNIANNFLYSFFCGVNPFYIYKFKLLNIFSLGRGGDLIYIIYWAVLGALFICLSAWFLKKRNPESRKSSFAFPALEYIIKVLISFTAGILLGLVMGASGGKNGLVMFILGFLIASIPVYIVIHIIYNRGVRGLLKSSIALGITVIVGVFGFWFCDSNPVGFKSSAPAAGDVASAGIIDTRGVSREITTQMINGSVGDFTDGETIGKIVDIHAETVNTAGRENTGEKCAGVFENMLNHSVREIMQNPYYNSPGYIITYKFKNGTESTYFYGDESGNDVSFSGIFYIGSYESSKRNFFENQKIAQPLAEIEATDVYLEKYRPLFNLDNKYCDTFGVLGLDEDNWTYYYSEDESEQYVDDYSYIEGNIVEEYRYEYDYNGDTLEKASFGGELDAIVEALKKDIANDKEMQKHCKPYIGSVFTDGYYPDDIFYSEYLSQAGEDVKLALTFGYGYEDFGMQCGYDVYYIPESYTNTINALVEYRLIDEKTHAIYSYY